VVNLDGADGHLDTGTVWELGMATALGVPVIGYETHPTTVLGGIADSVDQWVLGFDQLRQKALMYTESLPRERSLAQYFYNPDTTKALIIGPDTSEDHDRVNLDILAALNTHAVPTRLVDSPSVFGIDRHIADQIFNGISYMVAVVDDRHPSVAWAMGQAYIRNIPIISFTNHDYGVNLMLLLSIVRHVKGTEKLIEFVKEINEKGILNVDKVDYADVRAI
jgi:nucleoside 2-deoxyribosyltransferase